MKKLKYLLFVVRWLWANRTWQSSRQKWKALDKDVRRYMEGL